MSSSQANPNLCPIAKSKTHMYQYSSIPSTFISLDISKIKKYSIDEKNYILRIPNILRVFFLY